jgi:endo-1,3(4)-beta-glucanase
MDGRRTFMLRTSYASRQAIVSLSLSLSVSLSVLAACGGDAADPAPSPGPAAADASSGSSADVGVTVDAGRPGDPVDAGAAGDAAVAAPWTLGEPFGTDAPPFASIAHSLPPTALWGATTGARPTNAAWEDLVLGSGENPVNLFPYLVKARASGLEVGAPRVVTQATAVFSSFVADYTFGAKEGLGARAVSSFDALSVTLAWGAPSGPSLVAPLVRGMPYATLRYAGLTPVVTGARAITAVNGAPLGGAARSVTGDRFELAMNDGSSWILYASAPITFACTTQALAGSAVFTGTLRLAKVFGAGDASVLDAHRGAYAEGGAFEARVANGRLESAIRWKRAGAGPLLMATLPHHRASIASGASGATGAPLASFAIPTLRGRMGALAGDTWLFSNELVAADWGAPRPIDPARREAVRAALAADRNAQTAAQDPYFYGKQIAKLGRLALIADELGEAATASAIRDRMKGSLDPWLEGRNADPLVYDRTWGGIVRRGAASNAGADFGMGFYNDHHFHYGYFLYAAAALGKGDPAWLRARRAPLLALARDIANPSARDAAFTPFRHMDFFESHAWAGGLFPFADGRNQESTSEAVNAWYGLALLGRALGDANVEHVGRMLTTLEIQGAKAYWQITSAGGVYAEPFAQKKVVGILWGGKVDYATWFGANPEFIHGIQLLPFTPVSEALLGRAWVAEQYPVLAQALGPNVEQGWKGFVHLEHAILDKDAAWREVNALTGFDDGNTKTNALYWVATRP